MKRFANGGTNAVIRPYTRPELLATGPNQVWSWDITKLKGPRKWTYFYLYVILDIFSRQVVGWMVADCESASLAKTLIRAVTRRCELLEVARSTVYYRPTGISAEDLALMRLLDEIHLERPFYGSRRLRDELDSRPRGPR